MISNGYGFDCCHGVNDKTFSKDKYMEFCAGGLFLNDEK